MTSNERLKEKVLKLIEGWENETVEFKRGGKGFSTDEIGRYFSALSNEANLRKKNKAWLVFGIDDKTQEIIGSDYRLDSQQLDSIKHQIFQNTTTCTTFRNVSALTIDDKRVILFEIPPAPLGLPVGWGGHFYARAGESLVPLDIGKIDQIRSRYGLTDWSAEIVPGATVDNLDAHAVEVAKNGYSQTLSTATVEEVNSWSTEIFLQRMRLMDGDENLTKAAILLLGKPESSILLSPNPAEIAWVYRGEEKTYEHFGLPFLLTATDLYNRLRNSRVRILPDNSLIPVEIWKYDQKSILELLYNCIAHQNYYLGARINVIEYPDKIIFESPGEFFDGEPSNYVVDEMMPRKYRNSLLASAMVSFNLIDQVGTGINSVFLSQASRYLPLPDYDIESPDEVRVTVYGSIIDINYSRALIKNKDLSIDEIISLDKLQKGVDISIDEALHLKELGLIEEKNLKYQLIEGNKLPNEGSMHIGESMHFKLLIDYLKQYEYANRHEINTLLLPEIDSSLPKDDKIKYINNLLTKMRRKKLIDNIGSRTEPKWVALSAK